MGHPKWLSRDKTSLSFLHPAARCLDVMAGALAAILDHEDERYTWQSRKIEGVWVSNNSQQPHTTYLQNYLTKQ